MPEVKAGKARLRALNGDMVSGFIRGHTRVYAKALGPLNQGEELMREFEDSQPKGNGVEEKSGGVTRREFLEMGVVATLGAGAEKIAWAADTKNEVPRRTLGRTGEKVSIVGLGGYHIGHQKDEQESIRIIRTALDGGINFMDNCWDYNGGESEVRMGKALRDGYRQRAFLMTKIDGRTKQAAAQQLEESLKRLQTDHIDLLQIHEVIRMEDPDRVFAASGGLEALVAAREAGKIRYIGFTGHKSPDIHLKMLQVADAHQFHFDTVQMPLNVMDAHYNSFQRKVLPVLVKKEIGVLGMKPMGDGIILRSKTVEPMECLHYSMSLPTSVVITGCDSVKLVEQAVTAAKTFKPMNEMQIATLLAKTKDAAQKGEFEGYKTTSNFDGTAHNPQWLG
jgi:aryl-alcohol dehydrogenase-like predicted oxidoreductase